MDIQDFSIFVNQTDSIKNIFNWEEISKYDLPIPFIKKYHKYLDWNYISKYSKITMEFMNEFENLVDFDMLSYNKLTSEIIFKYSEKLDWKLLQKYTIFTNDMIDEFKDKIDFNLLLSNYNYNEDTILHILNIHSQDNIKELLNTIIINQKISENFIVKFKDINLKLVSKYQKLSNDFIKNNIYKLDLQNICEYQKFDDETLKIISQHIATEKPNTINIFINTILKYQTFHFTNENIKLITNIISINTDHLEMIIHKNTYTFEVYQILLEKFKNKEKLIRDETFYKCIHSNIMNFDDIIFLELLRNNVSEMCETMDVLFKNANTRLNLVNLSKIKKYITYIPWFYITKKYAFSETDVEFLINNSYVEKYLIYGILNQTNCTQKFIEKYIDYIKWWKYVDPINFYKDVMHIIAYGNKYVDNNLEKNMKLFDLNEFLKMVVKKTDWEILKTELFDEWFLRIFAHYDIDKYFTYISRYQQLSESFIRKYIEKFELKTILKYQKISNEYRNDLIQFLI